ncbi:MAG: response regulator transcription factor [Schleiferiaceae bacterium]|jgi:two-component system alkaline phosphatase synthesis response regulator PhoP|nr:response regulator transcription factor [Schleiferiaceae bacterium]MDG1919308.1 response regulator transcription factor [Schleiferiaceae bacterium]MDG2110967.1 response regulator transcription factor [Schleiferiaceae bacterium]
MTNLEPKVLIVDDDVDILEFVTLNLSNEGFKVYTASNGLEAIQRATDIAPDLIILDVMMPEMDGVEACIRLRKIPSLDDTVIVFLSARHEDYSQIAGLNAGADDYITKPIRPKLLVAKLKTMLRRRFRALEESTEELILGEMVIDFKKYHVLLNGKEEVLPRKEFELLTLLAKNAGIVIRREEIMKRIWQSDVIVGGRTIDVHIRRLRERIGDDKIKTVKGVGYKLVVA